MRVGLVGLQQRLRRSVLRPEQLRRLRERLPLREGLFLRELLLILISVEGAACLGQEAAPSLRRILQ
jgi:hypothetical protein